MSPDGEWWPAAADPRKIPASDYLDEAYIPDLLGSHCLLLLDPLGDTADDEDGLTECPDGWTITATVPVDAMFGPQAAAIVAAIDLAERALCGDTMAVGDRYVAAIDEQYPDGGAWTAQSAADAAQAALDAAGADGLLWAKGFSCAYGQEMLALAARDLIGTVPGWTQEAYDLLTAPWVAAFGRAAHSDDKIAVPVSR